MQVLLANLVDPQIQSAEIIDAVHFASGRANQSRCRQILGQNSVPPAKAPGTAPHTMEILHVLLDFDDAKQRDDLLNRVKKLRPDLLPTDEQELRTKPW